MIVLLIIILCVAMIVLVSIIYAKKNGEKTKRDEAAQMMLKYEYLDYSLLNKSVHGYVKAPDKNSRLMIYIETCNVKPAVKYVFDPLKGIVIGRDRAKCNICISEATVSSVNSTITVLNNALIIQDNNSANGTFLKRGLFKKYRLYNSQTDLRNNDKITIGSTTMKVTLFYYNSIAL